MRALSGGNLGAVAEAVPLVLINVVEQMLGVECKPIFGTIVESVLNRFMQEFNVFLATVHFSPKDEVDFPFGRT